MHGCSQRLWLLVAVALVASMPAAGVRAQETAPGETERLRRQVSYLAEALAKTKAEADALKARLDEKVAGDRRPAAVPGGGRAFEISDVNSELGMVILGGGRTDGVKPGMRFAVMQGDRAVATVRVVEVRAAIAGAVIETLNRAYPKVRDRAVVMADGGN